MDGVDQQRPAAGLGAPGRLKVVVGLARGPHHRGHHQPAQPTVGQPLPGLLHHAQVTAVVPDQRLDATLAHRLHQGGRFVQGHGHRFFHQKVNAALAAPLALLQVQGVGGGDDHRFRFDAVQHLLGITKPGCCADVKPGRVSHRVGHGHQLGRLRHGEDGLDVAAADQAGAQHGDTQWCHGVVFQDRGGTLPPAAVSAWRHSSRSQRAQATLLSKIE